ncbi:MAG: hypothetical protein Q8O67_18125 [Deltaproteobacteria bacterium]|nr:hypothetical protein [Deltaproteobacteria bacterium]
MRELLLIAFILVAAALPMPSRPVVVSRAWNPRFVQLATLGAERAAAELMWMRTVQVIGDPHFERDGKPHLIKWLEGVTTLDPSLHAPYFLGAVLLVARKDDSIRLDAMLAKAETLAPDDFEFPQLRGFVAYFSGLDPAAAAAHYERAAAMPGAPAYLAPFAQRLRKQGLSCRAVSENLRDLGRRDAGVRRWLTGDDDALLRSCIKEQLSRAAAQHRLLGLGPAPTVEDLIARGLLPEAPPAPPGECWLMVNGVYLLGQCEDKQ